MNTLWLKIASGAIGILIIIVLVSMFMPGGEKPAPAPEETNPSPITDIYGQANKDKQDFLVEEEPANPTSQEQPNEVSQTTNEPVTPNNVSSQAVPVQPQQTQPAEVTIYVKPLVEMEKIEAEREINYAVPSLSIGRLPMTSYKPMIDSARRIIDRWPDSIYAFQAKRMLAKVPERFHQQYNITPEEMDTSMFFTSRAGTVPYKVKIEDR